ncbi:fructose-specific PTS transporter subunit EIIC [Lacticaseibacillus daqingensis]|uniref:fructose-specific PTS transporter subunit EIIC n=1 Tax=Lacticaseibacillus daqingensis TaxID=2486014 RepID=UPI000F799161|nr:fructose-specific PTS transporter subunit EIIC [Lacticaseibacillus daqingensis]
MAKSTGFSWGEVKRHLVAGVNYMLPVIIIGALFKAIITFMPKAFPLYDLFKFIADTGLQRFDIFCTMFIAYSVANKLALAPAFIFAVYANQQGLGIFGSIILGLLVGYMTKWLATIKMSGSKKALFSLVVTPTVVTLVLSLVTVFVLQAPLQFVNEWLKQFLTDLYGTNAILLGLLLGAMIGFDLGGPVNKVAGLFALTMLNEGVHWPITMATAAFGVPSLAIGLAAILDRHRLFDEDDQIASKTAFVMGFLMMSEPAIPFMLEDPKAMIPINMLSCGTLCAIYAVFKIDSTVALGPLFSAAYTNNPLIGVGAFVLVVILTALVITVRRRHRVSTGSLDVN